MDVEDFFGKFYNDEFILNKIYESNMEQVVDFYYQKASSMLCSILGDEAENAIVSLVDNSTRLVFLVKTSSESFVLHFPRNSQEWRERNEARHQLALKNDFEIAESKEGIRLEYLAESSFEWNSIVVRHVLEKIHDLHSSGKEIQFYQDNMSYLREAERKTEIIPTGLGRSIQRLLKYSRNSCASVLCHGDLWCGNVLLWKESPYIIDWELLCMGDPLFDIAKLYTTVKMTKKASFGNYYDWLSMYYGTVPDEKKLGDAVYMLLFVRYVMLLYMLRKGTREKNEIDRDIILYEDDIDRFFKEDYDAITEVDK